MGGGGQGSTTTTVDPVYNAGMLELSQEQQQWASEMFNMFKYGVSYDPSEQVLDPSKVTEGTERVQTGTRRRRVRNPDYRGPDAGGGEPWIWKEEPVYETRNISEQDPNAWTTRGELEGYDPEAQISEMQYLQNLVEANQGLLTSRSGAESAQLALETQQANAAAGLIPAQTEAAQTGYEYTTGANRAATGLLPYQTEAQRTGYEYTTGLNTARSGLLPAQSNLAKRQIGAQTSFIEEAQKGVDAKGWMNEAQAGVQHGYKLANEALRKDISSYGLDPGSARYASQNRDLRMREGADIAGARTVAQRAAEQEDFNRKRAAATGLTIPSI